MERFKDFSKCASLASIRLPDSVKTIGRYAFDGCEKLSRIYTPSNLDQIGHYAFSECKSLKYIYFAKKVSAIHDNAFEGCVQIKEVVVPQAFLSCTGLTSVTYLGLDDIGEVSAFEQTNLKYVSVHTIYRSEFCGLRVITFDPSSEKPEVETSEDVITTECDENNETHMKVWQLGLIIGCSVLVLFGSVLIIFYSMVRKEVFSAITETLVEKEI